MKNVNLLVVPGTLFPAMKEVDEDPPPSATIPHLHSNRHLEALVLQDLSDRCSSGAEEQTPVPLQDLSDRSDDASDMIRQNLQVASLPCMNELEYPLSQTTGLAPKQGNASTSSSSSGGAEVRALFQNNPDRERGKPHEQFIASVHGHHGDHEIIVHQDPEPAEEVPDPPPFDIPYHPDPDSLAGDIVVHSMPKGESGSNGGHQVQKVTKSKVPQVTATATESGAKPKLSKSMDLSGKVKSGNVFGYDHMLRYDSSNSEPEASLKANSSKARSLRKTKSRGKGKGARGCQLNPADLEGLDDFSFNNVGYSSESDGERKNQTPPRKYVPGVTHKECWS